MSWQEDLQSHTWVIAQTATRLQEPSHPALDMESLALGRRLQSHCAEVTILMGSNQIME